MSPLCVFVLTQQTPMRLVITATKGTCTLRTGLSPAAYNQAVGLVQQQSEPFTVSASGDRVRVVLQYPTQQAGYFNQFFYSFVETLEGDCSYVNTAEGPVGHNSCIVTRSLSHTHAHSPPRALNSYEISADLLPVAATMPIPVNKPQLWSGSTNDYRVFELSETPSNAPTVSASHDAVVCVRVCRHKQQCLTNTKLGGTNRSWTVSRCTHISCPAPALSPWASARYCCNSPTPCRPFWAPRYLAVTMPHASAISTASFKTMAHRASRHAVSSQQLWVAPVASTQFTHLPGSTTRPSTASLVPMCCLPSL